VIENLLDIKVFSLMAAILKQKQERLSKNIDDTEHEIDVAQSKLKVHEDYITSLHEDKATLLRQLRAKVKKGEGEVDRLIKDTEDLNGQVVELKQSISDKQQVEAKLKKIVDLERRLEDKLQHLRRDIQFYEQNDNCPTCAQGIDHDFKEHTLAKDHDKVKEVEDALKELEDHHSTESSRLAEINTIVDQIVELTGKISNINTSISHYRNHISDLQTEIEDLKSQNLHKTEKEVEQLSNQITELNSSKEKLLANKEVQDAAATLLKDNGIKTSIVKQYVPIINKLINKYLAAMGQFINFELDENFSETIRSEFRDEFSYGNFSEGEKLRIDLAILFTWRAIAKMRNSMSTNLLVLDEIFDSSLDYVGVDDFLNLMQDISQDVSGGSNIFIISHKTDQLIDKFDQVIKFEKVKNFSRIAL
jgi:DNA repair exonuclease SbcCD ATPase subunit